MIAIDYQTDFEVILRIFLAFALGGLVGWERERHGMSAGIRTYGAIALGSCVFGVLSLLLPGADPSRIAAQVATGVGFLGGGVIFKQGNYISGLTTAATLWATAALGVAVAFGMYLISFMVSILLVLMLYLPRLSWWKKITGKTRKTESTEN